MGFGVVRNLITHARLKNKRSTVLKFGVQLALEAEKNMAFDAPVVSQIAGRVFKHTDTDIAEISGFPIGKTCFTLMFRALDRRPVDGSKRHVIHLHMTPEML